MTLHSRLYNYYLTQDGHDNIIIADDRPVDQPRAAGQQQQHTGKVKWTHLIFRLGAVFNHFTPRGQYPLSMPVLAKLQLTIVWDSSC